jgi:hypothetical protein
MTATLLIFIFVLGYIAIAFEHPLKLNKAASALITVSFAEQFIYSKLNLHKQTEICNDVEAIVRIYL